MNKMKRKLPEVIIMGLIALAMMAGPAFGATYNLRAGTIDMAMPGGAVITMWGYALVSFDLTDDNADNPVAGDNIVTVPGPRLRVPPLQGLTVKLTNELDVPVSIIIPGQIGDSPQVVRNPDGRVRSFTHETPAAVNGTPGGPISYTWSNIKPGTYLYHSGTHPAVQVQMGLYGAVTKNAADANAAPAQAYPDLGTAYEYDEEVVLIYSEIDPALHAAVANGDYGPDMTYTSTIDYHPKYFLVNGVAGDAAGPVAIPEPGSNVLIRFLNAGLKGHAPEILGSHLSVIAEDGNLYPYPRQQYSMLLAAGKTLDALFSSSTAGDYPIFDRRAYRTNDATVQGAMHTYISFDQPPMADPNGPYAANVGDVITFDGSGSTDSDGTIVSYDWDFGDGNTGTGESPDHIYAASGTYTVSLTVTDDKGATNTASTTADINGPPVADPNGPYAANVGDVITFDGSGSTDSDGTIDSYDWDFGDGTPPALNAGVNPTHSYATAGIFTVSLTVTDNDGATNTASTTADINAPPAANPNGPYTGTVGVEVSFNGSGSTDSDGTIDSYEWDFGDGNIDTGVTPTHIYAADGTYTVSLTVTDNDGATNTASTTADINAPPAADPNGPYTGTVGVEVSFNGSGSTDSDGTIDSYEWDFGDGNTDTGVTPTHIYAAAGTYTVSLTVRDNDGATNTASTTADIITPP